MGKANQRQLCPSGSQALVVRPNEIAARYSSSQSANAKLRSFALGQKRALRQPANMQDAAASHMSNPNNRGAEHMTFVVTDNCIKCKYTDCVEVCPVDCFYGGPNFLVIHPDECIDCALCEPECPANAIFAEDEVPEDQQQFIELNAELADIWPNITEKKDALPDAEEWDGVPDKLQHLER